MVALPNVDTSFTATLFMMRDGVHSSRQLDSVETVTNFFEREFPELAKIDALEAVVFAGQASRTPDHGGRCTLVG